jgi:hypothetical protein
MTGCFLKQIQKKKDNQMTFTTAKEMERRTHTLLVRMLTQRRNLCHSAFTTPCNFPPTAIMLRLLKRSVCGLNEMAKTQALIVTDLFAFFFLLLLPFGWARDKVNKQRATS